jgi:imidazolonepropionase-like amidohydrolase
MRHISTLKLIALLAAGLAATPGHAGALCKDEVKFPADANSFVVRDVRVVDGGNVLEHANVVVRAGRIRSVGQDAPPGDLKVVDGAGRTLIAGPAADISDLGAYGAAMHAKLAGMTKGGMSTLEAIKLATSATARATSPDYRGRVAPGSYADLILVNGNPVADINATRSIARAFKNGVEVKRGAPAAP